MRDSGHFGVGEDVRRGGASNSTRGRVGSPVQISAEKGANGDGLGGLSRDKSALGGICRAGGWSEEKHQARKLQAPEKHQKPSPNRSKWAIRSRLLGLARITVGSSYCGVRSGCLSPESASSRRRLRGRLGLARPACGTRITGRFLANGG